MKKGFTMVELIFVIIILGILASVTIPKLNTTRSDAEIVKAKANLATMISDIQSYYTSKGDIPEPFNLQNLTTVPLYHNAKGDPSQNVNAAWIGVKEIKECLYIEVNRGRESGEDSFMGFKTKEAIPQNSTCAEFIKYVQDINMFKEGYKKRNGNRYAIKDSTLNQDVLYIKLGGSKVVW